MNPLGMLGNAAGAIGQGIGNIAHGVENYFWKAQPTGQVTQNFPNNPMSLKIQSPVPVTKVSNQLPPYIKSPVPQSSVVSKPIAPSMFQNNVQSMQQGIGTIQQGMGNFTKLFAPPPQMPQQPQQHPLVQHALNRFGAPQQAPQQAPQTQIGIPHINNVSPLRVATSPSQTGSFQTQQLPTHVPGVSDQFIQLLNNQILPETRKAGIPDAVVAAQTAAESAYGKSPLSQYNNFWGITDPNARNADGSHVFQHFATPQEGLQWYTGTHHHLLPNGQQYKNAPLEYLKALQSGKQRYEADNKDPMQYVYDLSRTPVWGAYGGGNPYPTNPMYPTPAQ